MDKRVVEGGRERKPRRSRRELLAGAAGAIGVLGAEAIAKAAPAVAADGAPMLQGVDNGPAVARTSILTNNWTEFAVLADSSGGAYGSLGVWGHGKVQGVVGEANPGNGGTGVYGIGDGFGQGVLGKGGLSGGVGVQGNAGNSGDGVLGYASSGNGVHGIAQGSGGVGVLAENTAGGTALHATGTAKFDSLIQASRSGTVIIPSGQKIVTVTPPGGLTSASLVMALMQNVAGGVVVKAAIPNPSAGTFQIVLNKAPLSPATAKVAWFVVN